MPARPAAQLNGDVDTFQSCSYKVQSENLAPCFKTICLHSVMGHFIMHQQKYLAILSEHLALNILSSVAIRGELSCLVDYNTRKISQADVNLCRLVESTFRKENSCEASLEKDWGWDARINYSTVDEDLKNSALLYSCSSHPWKFSFRAWITAALRERVAIKVLFAPATQHNQIILNEKQEWQFNHSWKRYSPAGIVRYNCIWVGTFLRVYCHVEVMLSRCLVWSVVPQNNDQGWVDCHIHSSWLS